MIAIHVNIKSVSNKQNKIKQMSISYDEKIQNVRELILATVKYCVENYNERMENSEILKALSIEQIENQAAQGKVSFGINYGEKRAELSKAEADALEAFEDGIAVIFADEKKLESLDEKIEIQKIKSLTFVKLTMLAGRMW